MSIHGARLFTDLYFDIIYKNSWNTEVEFLNKLAIITINEEQEKKANKIKSISWEYSYD